MSKRNEEHLENEISIEPEEEFVDGFGRSPKEKKLKEEIKKCQKEKQEYLEGWQRSKADLINKKKEFEEDKKRLVRLANKGLIHDLAGVLDSFSIAFSNKDSWEKVDEGWRKGIEYIHSQFIQVLKDYNLQEIDPKGEEFDPENHESLELVSTDKEEEDGLVESVIRKGYELEGVTIRPAHVRVYRYKAE